jgi:hypothetical protein
MPVGVLVESAPVTAEIFDAVEAKIPGGNDQEGLLIRTAGPKEGGGFRVYSVWESKEDYERFRDERLIPALREVAGEEAASGPSGAEVYELHEFFSR